MQERMSEKSRTQCGKPVSENSRMQLEFRDGAAVMMAWQHYLYDGSGQLMAIRYKGADYYYIRDGLMTITGLVDANGAAVVNYFYDSWGNMLNITGSMAVIYTVTAKIILLCLWIQMAALPFWQ